MLIQFVGCIVDNDNYFLFINESVGFCVCTIFRFYPSQKGGFLTPMIILGVRMVVQCMLRRMSAW